MLKVSTFKNSSKSNLQIAIAIEFMDQGVENGSLGLKLRGNEPFEASPEVLGAHIFYQHILCKSKVACSSICSNFFNKLKNETGYIDQKFLKPVNNRMFQIMPTFMLFFILSKLEWIMEAKQVNLKKFCMEVNIRCKID